MTSLQTSFSEISRLAEEVAMQGPEPEEEGEKWNREMERVRLMIVAEGLSLCPGLKKDTYDQSQNQPFDRD